MSDVKDRARALYDQMLACFRIGGYFTARGQEDPYESILAALTAAVEAERARIVAFIAASDKRIAELENELANERRTEGSPYPDPKKWAAAIHAECRGSIVDSRVVPYSEDHGVCIGGRFDGWIMWKHPDGQWVSINKPEPDASHSELLPVFAGPPTDPITSARREAFEECERIAETQAEFDAALSGVDPGQRLVAVQTARDIKAAIAARKGEG